MYELKKTGKVLTSKSVGTGSSSYDKRIYGAAVSQRLRSIGLYNATHFWNCAVRSLQQPRVISRKGVFVRVIC